MGAIRGISGWNSRTRGGVLSKPKAYGALLHGQGGHHGCMPMDSSAELRPCLGYPAPQQRQLENGCPVTLLPLADASVACLQFWCQAGSLREQSGEAGIAHFLEHMVFKGSDGLPAGAFDHRVEAVGGQ